MMCKDKARMKHSGLSSKHDGSQLTETSDGSADLLEFGTFL